MAVLRRLGVAEARLRHGLVEARNKIDLVAAPVSAGARSISGGEEDGAEAAASTAGAEDNGVGVGAGGAEAGQSQPPPGSVGGDRKGKGGRGPQGPRGRPRPSPFSAPFEVGVSSVTTEGLDLLGGVIESVRMLRGRNGEGCWAAEHTEGAQSAERTVECAKRLGGSGGMAMRPSHVVR